MATRHQARIAVIGFLYAYDIGNKNIINVSDYILEENNIRNKQRQFSKYMFKGAIKNLDKVDEYIIHNLKNWDYQSIGKIEKSILRLATYEMLIEKRPHHIVINEAIELAKKLSDNKSSKFINAILDSILKYIQKIELEEKKIVNTVTIT